MKVMIVDDNETNRKLLRVNLEGEGLETCEAQDGVEALEKLDRAHVCIIGLGGVGSWIAEALARAAATPNQRCCRPAVECASGLITQRTPFSFASGHQRQSMSRREGLAFSSIQVPFAAAASMTAGTSTA